MGTLKRDLPCGGGEANRFDLYLPGDSARSAYGLVVCLHAGGFTAGDKADGRDTLARLCSRGEECDWIPPLAQLCAAFSIS